MVFLFVRQNDKHIFTINLSIGSYVFQIHSTDTIVRFNKQEHKLIKRVSKLILSFGSFVFQFQPTVTRSAFETGHAFA